MSENSAIEWTEHTFNPWWGCTRVSEACQHCYAETFAKRTGHKVWGKNADRRFFADKHWNEPLKWNAAAEKAGRPARVFCASMADVFEDHPGLEPHRQRLWSLIGETPWLTWLLLTKRPERMVEVAPWTVWPDNVWAGTTVENQRWADERISELLRVDARVRFLSCEPLLGPVDLTGPALGYISARGVLADDWLTEGRYRNLRDSGLSWVIAGGESGPGARPMLPDWARLLRYQCEKAGIPFLFKQWGDWNASGCRVGKKAAGRELDGRTHDAFPVLVPA